MPRSLCSGPARWFSAGGQVFLGLVATGYRCTLWCSGDTTTCEVGIAGLITLVFLVDVFVLVLGGTSILTYGWMGLVLAGGLAGTSLGGYLRGLTQVQVAGGRTAA